MLQDLKTLLKFGFDITKQVAVSGADGWQFTDAFSFFDEVMQLPAVIKSLPGAKEAITNLSVADKSDLDEWIQSEFDIPNDKVEKFIENSLQLVTAGISLANEWKELKKAS